MTKWHNVDEQLLTAVGTVTVAFSRLEWIISGFIWQLLSPNQMIGQTITANLTFRSKLDLLSSLLELLPSTEIPKIFATIQRSWSVASSRVFRPHAQPGSKKHSARLVL